MMQDSADNFSTWENWKISLDQAKIDLFNHGMDAVEVATDLDEFRQWCETNGLPRNGSSRSRFAAMVLKRGES